jgi:hypothetical protein
MNGGRVLLLADRAWSASGQPNIWAVTSVEEIGDTARMIVGPDEPFGGRSQKDMEADHWASLAAVLRRQGVDVDALELGRLEHDVVLSEPVARAHRPSVRRRRPVQTLLRGCACLAVRGSVAGP